MKNQLFIKNMVCPRCLTAVENIAQKLHIPYDLVELGGIQTARQLSDAQKREFGEELSLIGFELLDDRAAIIVNQLRGAIIEFNQTPDNQDQNLSQFIRLRVPGSYSALSRLFSQVEGMTIEKYSLRQKVEKIKELLSYEQLSVKEIAYELNMSSPSYLSTLFKRETGMSIREFKESVGAARQGLDSI